MSANATQKPIYKGGWQFEDRVREELPGPCGEGEVFYPNDDYFKGNFCLSYASIWGKAYLAEGKYTFADGSYIERAFVDFNPAGTVFSLVGFSRIKHPDGPDSLVFVRDGKYYGIELVLADKPFVREWYDGEELHRDSPLELDSYEWDHEKGDHMMTLNLYMHNAEGAFEMLIRGGKVTENSYGNYIFEPKIYISVNLPNGDSFDDEYSGCALRQLKPYDGYVVYHCAAQAQYRKEQWEEGALKEAKEWERDVRAAKKCNLPAPVEAEEELTAWVWDDGHIEYGYDEWVYDGEIKDDMPNGKGVVVGDRRHGERRYEGLFKDGRYVETEHFDGVIKLHIRTGHKHWSISNDGEWEYEEEDRIAALGRLNIDGFFGYEITKIEPSRITIAYYDEVYYLTPDEPVSMYNEIEGREYSDGCVYDGDEYRLHITWVKE